MNIPRSTGKEKARLGNQPAAIGRDRLWRSLDDLAQRPDFLERLHREFPRGASEWTNELHRRDFLRLMGASVALAGVGACTKQPIEKIVPYVEQPENVVPGKPLYFASATSFRGYGQGIVVKSNEGRPTKIEGNRDHPASLGATTIWAQADLLDLYDPDRAKALTNKNSISTWGVFLERLNLALGAQSSSGGTGIRFLTQTVTSPTLAAQLQGIALKFPGARWHQWDPLTRDASRDAKTGGVFGAEVLYDFAKAKVIVALDSDFLCLHPAALKHTHDFAGRRRIEKPEGATMSRFYAAEPTPSITGSNADHRLPVASRDIPQIAAALAALVGAGGAGANVPHNATEWLWAAAQDLRANIGESIVIAGESQPSEVHVLVAQINQSLGNVGATIRHCAPVESNPVNQLQSLQSLIDDLQRTAVDLLIILGGNPVYDAPINLDFAQALQKVRLSVHHSLHANETSARCHWHVPATHFLESWSDIRAFDGTVTIVQPLVEPLYDGISAHQLLDAFVGQPVRSAYELVKSTWQKDTPSNAFESQWRNVLSSGATPGIGGELTPAPGPAQIVVPQPSPDTAADSLEIIFRPDPGILDGSYANNGWLQELPRPFSKVTWDNTALISPVLARREKLENGDYIELTFRERKLDAPVWIIPGQAENTITLHLGYGRQRSGRVGTNKGYNAYALRTSDSLWQGSQLAMRKLGRRVTLATTQNHFNIEGRAMYRAGTLAEFLQRPHFAPEMAEVPKHDETLYHPDEFRNSGYAWGMVIDLNTCTGCNACTIACQAENNIPVVGKTQVIRGREMHWIRVDLYHAGSEDTPEFHHQPVPCMHCQHAPCELVCPVAATVTDDEGLNVQVYNRCVGTRYCSNNCPYKVRRFNFLEYNGALSPSEKLVENPDVTVRCRGVMEKCTYCLQRINAARITAQLESRRIRDGEIIPACAQVCPAEAITFGDTHDPKSRVACLKQRPLNYGMLAELNTRPRTSYAAKLWNASENLKS
ncbi:MAG TPA: TAT-variant-translocated molybdopterin oxidoreductase [Chthoniobacterales bacterium]|jgi:molybdopterin-containing oxidoreductase family iron-sulfur binding subunit